MIGDEIFKSNKINDKVDEQLKAIKLLTLQGYTVIDLEGNIIDKWNYNKKNKPTISPLRYNTRSRS
tara:strand:- start:26 stop:223 length:198 start_codon:yes stop_codon:yes gene_type:complete